MLRRALVLGGAAFALQAGCRAVAESLAGAHGQRIHLADFGGVPGASRASIAAAFVQAFRHLKKQGGGVLEIGAGTYNLGPYSGGAAITVSDLQNVLISGYGAQLTMRTVSKSTPVFFRFNNPDNVTVAGLAFRDHGTDLNVDWKGAHCIVVQTTRPCSRFKTVDCVADNVVAFLSSQPSSASHYTFEDFDIHARIRNAYYGVNPNFNGSNSRVNLTAHNVRRAFIGYGLRNWELTVAASADGTAPGSNALIEIAADDRGSVDTVKVNLTVTGNLRKYNGLVTLFHQSSSGVRRTIRNVQANVTLNKVARAAEAVFFFPYWDPDTQSIEGSTINSWEDIYLRARVIGKYDGLLIVNRSTSSASTNAIHVESDWLASQDMLALPEYFHVKNVPRSPEAR